MQVTRPCKLYENFEKGFLFKNQEEKRELEKKDIFFGKTHAIFKKLLRKTDMQTRWVIGSLYINGKVSKKISNKKILYNATSYSKYLLHLVGYVKIKNIGIRPGEKIHEVLCAANSSHLILNFRDHLVLQPSIKLNKNFKINGLKEKGQSVEKNFVYVNNFFFSY